MSRGRPNQVAPRVSFDLLAGCWRIYVYSGPSGSGEDDPQNMIRWWPLEWMAFASREIAEAHLERNGDYKVRAAA